MGSGRLCAKCHQDLGAEACLSQVTHRDRQNQHTEGRLLCASPGYLWWDWGNITVVVNNVFCSWIKMVCRPVVLACLALAAVLEESQSLISKLLRL